MKKTLSMILAATTLLTVGAAAVPAFAAPAAGNASTFCSSNAGGDTLRMDKSQLAQQLQLKTKAGASIDDWANCFKVSYVDANGHQVVALYDPDTLSVIQNLS